MQKEINVHSYLKNLFEENIYNIEEDREKFKTGVDNNIGRNLAPIQWDRQLSVDTPEKLTNIIKNSSEERDPRYLSIITGYDSQFNKKVKLWIKDVIRRITYKEQMIDHYSHKSLFDRERKTEEDLNILMNKIWLYLLQLS